MDRTAADRQAAYRRRMKARGYRLMQVWVDAEGFPGKAQERDGAQRPELTLSQLEEVLVRVTDGTDEAFANRLFGELAAYAKGIREVWDLSRLNRGLFEDGHEEVSRTVSDLYFK